MRLADLLIRISAQGAQATINSINGVGSAANSAARGVSGLGAAAKATALALATLAIAREVLEATIAWERMNNTMRAATGSSLLAAYNFKFLREESERLGLDFRTVADDFARMESAARGTILQGDKVRLIFSAVGSAATVMGLSSERTSAIMSALTTMMSKGVVQSQDLRRRLETQLPGSLKIFADALGVGTARLNQMVRAGEVGRPELVKFAEELLRVMGPEVARASMSTQAQINRFKTAVFELLVAIGQTGVIQMFTDSLTDLTKLIQANIEWFDNLAVAVAATRDAFASMMELWNEIPTSGKVILSILAAVALALTGPTTAAFAVVAGAIVTLITYWHTLQASAAEISAKVVDIFGAMVSGVYTTIAGISDAVAKAADFVGADKMAKKIRGVADAYKSSADQVIQDSNEMSQNLREVAQDHIDAEAKRMGAMKSTGEMSEKLRKMLEAAGIEDEEATKKIDKHAKMLADTLEQAASAADDAEEKMRQYGASADEIMRRARAQDTAVLTVSGAQKGGAEYGAALDEVAQKEMDVRDATEKMNREHAVTKEFLRSLAKGGQEYGDAMADYKDRELQANDASKEAAKTLEVVKASFDALSSAVENVHKRSEIVPRGWTPELLDLDKALAVAKAATVGILPGSAQYEAAQKRLAAATKAFRNEVALLTKEERANQLAAAAEVEARVVQIDRETKMLQLSLDTSGRAALEYQRQQRVHDEIENTLKDLKPYQGESAEEFEARWITAANNIKEALIKQFRREDWNTVMQPGIDAVKSMGETLKSTIAAYLTGEEVDFKKLFKNVLNMWIQTLLEMIARAKVAGPIMAALNQQGGGGGVAGNLLYSGGVNGASALAQRGAQGAVSGAGNYIYSGGVSGAAYAYGSSGATGVGATGGSSALAGWAVAAIYVAIIVAVVAFIVHWVEVHRSTRAQMDIVIKDNQFTAGVGAGVDDRLKMLKDGVISPLVKNLNDYIKGLGAIVKDLNGTIGISRSGRNTSNQFTVYVKPTQFTDYVLNFGRDADAAMKYAFYRALQITDLKGTGSVTLDPIVTKAIHSAAKRAADQFYKGITDAEKTAISDEFNRLTSEAQQVSLMGKPGTVQNLDALNRNVDQLLSDMLLLLGPSKEFDQAIQNITADMSSQLQAQRDELTGRQKTAEEEYQDRLRSVHMWNAELALRKLDLEARIEDEKAKIADAEITLGLAQATSEHTRVAVAAAGALGDSAARLAEVTAAAGGMTATELETMKAHLAAIQAILNAMPSEISDSEVIRNPSSGTGASNKRQQIKDFLDAAAWDRYIHGLSDYGRAVAEVNKKYDDEMKLAGKNASEIKKLTDARRAELQQLRQDQIKKVNTDISDFENSPAKSIQDIKDKALELKKSVMELGMSSERTATALARITNAEAAQLKVIENNIVGTLYGYLSDNLAYEGQIKDFKIAQLNAEFQSYKIQLAALGAWDKWSGLWEAALAAGTKAIQDGSAAGGSGITNGKFSYANSSSNAVDSAVSQIESDRAKWEEAMKGWENAGVDPLVAEFNNLTATFDGLRSEAIRLGMDEGRVAQLRAKAFADFWNKTLQPIRDLRSSMDLSDLSPLDPKARLQSAYGTYSDLAKRAESGDYTSYAALAQAAQAYLKESMSYNASGAAADGYGGYSETYASVKALLDRILGGSNGKILPFDPSNVSQSSIQVNFPGGTEIAKAQSDASRQEHTDLTTLTEAVNGLRADVQQNTLLIRGNISGRTAAGGRG